LFRAFGLLPVRLGLGLKIRDALFRRAELMGKPLGCVNRMSAILLGYVGSFVEKMEDRLTGLIELRVGVRRDLAGARDGKDIRARSHTIFLYHPDPLRPRELLGTIEHARRKHIAAWAGMWIFFGLVISASQGNGPPQRKGPASFRFWPGQAHWCACDPRVQARTCSASQRESSESPMLNAF
jgi:hypothetical protein